MCDRVFADVNIRFFDDGEDAEWDAEKALRFAPSCKYFIDGAKQEIRRPTGLKEKEYAVSDCFGCFSCLLFWAASHACCASCL